MKRGRPLGMPNLTREQFERRRRRLESVVNDSTDDMRERWRIRRARWYARLRCAQFERGE